MASSKVQDLFFNIPNALLNIAAGLQPTCAILHKYGMDVVYTASELIAISMLDKYSNNCQGMYYRNDIIFIAY